MSWTRRQILALGMASWVFRDGIARAATVPTKSKRRAPRHLVVIKLTGGVDAILTTDPREKKDVEGWVDLPYSPDSILTSGALTLGPHLKPLAKHFQRGAILNGVQVKTANHETGGLQLLRMKTRPERQMPTVLDIIGGARDGQPLASVLIGASEYDYSPGFFDDLGLDKPEKSADGARDLTGMFDVIGDSSPEDLDRVAASLRRQADRLQSTGAPAAMVSAENLRQAASLLSRFPKLKPFEREDWLKDLDTSKPLLHGLTAQDYSSFSFFLDYNCQSLQRALWLLENDVTRSVYVKAAGPWDSHFENLRSQASASSFLIGVDRFLQELSRRKGQEGGTLLDETLVVICSEIGRFPGLNKFAGKDHFPEAPFLLFGAGIANGGGKGARFGKTNAVMEALPVSLDTGLHQPGGHQVVLDDVGATVLDLFGMKSEPYGYAGKVLRFLEAA